MSDGARAPIIVSALFGDADFAFLDRQRRAYFPPERNVIAAHCTLFHHLPPSIGDELGHRLADEVRAEPPKARLAGLVSLGRGVAYRIESEDLVAIRARLADAFAGLLVPQDAAPWRPHVTIQNKVEPAAARALKTMLERDFVPRPLAIAGLAAWDYAGGPWHLRSRHMFRG